jgi:hypothetical protein
VIAAALLAVSLLAPASVGTGIGGPVCLRVTAQPGRSYPLAGLSVSDTGSDGESISLRVVPDPVMPAARQAARLRQVPPSWITFGPSSVNAGPGQAVPVTVTLNVPPGAAPGPRESWVQDGTVSAPASGPGGHAVLGASATTTLVFTVGPSATPPPCDALILAQSTGKFPPWPTAAFATSGWAQVFARDGAAPSGRPDTAVRPGTAPVATFTPVAAPSVSLAKATIPTKLPVDWKGWAIVIGLIVAAVFAAGRKLGG